MSYFESWRQVAEALLSQALAGEPVLRETDAGEALETALGSGPDAGLGGTEAFGFHARLAGDVEGEFAVLLDGGLAEAALMGEGADQKAGWQELLREVFEAAAGDLLARTGRCCRVEEFKALEGTLDAGRIFTLSAGDRMWHLRVADLTREAVKSAAISQAENGAKGAAQERTAAPAPVGQGAAADAVRPDAVNPEQARPDMIRPDMMRPGAELLLDVELEAALRFGSREMPLGEILDLGPGDVVELDRQIADPVDLIVGNKIVARGEVVLVNGNFGLRVTEVAEPRKRLESIRCLF